MNSVFVWNKIKGLVKLIIAIKKTVAVQNGTSTVF